MNIFGSIRQLVTLVFAQNAQAITLEPNTGTTYTAARAVQLPPGDADSILVGDTSTQTITNKSISGSTNTLTSIPAASLTGQVAITNGGTGAATAAAAYNALSPMTTTGDLEYEASAGTAARLAIGSSGQVLTVVSGSPAWATPSVVSTYNATWITSDGTTKTVTHSLGTLDVMVQLYDLTDGSTIQIDSTLRTSTSVCTLTASQAPGAAGWRILIAAL